MKLVKQNEILPPQKPLFIYLAIDADSYHDMTPVKKLLICSHKTVFHSLEITVTFLQTPCFQPEIKLNASGYIFTVNKINGLKQ